MKYRGFSTTYITIQPCPWKPLVFHFCPSWPNYIIILYIKKITYKWNTRKIIILILYWRSLQKRWCNSKKYFNLFVLVFFLILGLRLYTAFSIAWPFAVPRTVSFPFTRTIPLSRSFAGSRWTRPRFVTTRSRTRPLPSIRSVQKNIQLKSFTNQK